MTFLCYIYRYDRFELFEVVLRMSGYKVCVINESDLCWLCGSVFTHLVITMVECQYGLIKVCSLCRVATWSRW